MPLYCTALKCTNNSDQGYSLFTYPKDEALKQKWIAAVGRGKIWSPSSSQKLCEVHFLPSEIEYVAKRKRVKFGAVPSRFCTCSLEDQKNHKKLRKKQKHRNSPYQRQASIGKQGDRCILHLPVKKDEVLADEQEKVEVVEIEKIVKVTEKTEEDVEDADKKIYKENYELKQQIKVLNERIQLTENVLFKDQRKALKTENSKGTKGSQETVIKALGLRFTCGIKTFS